MKTTIKVINIASLFFVMLMLIGCGAGGKATDPPNSPEPSADAKSEKVTITWEEIEGAHFYNIYWGTEPGVTTNSANKVKSEELSAVIEGLTNDQIYYFIVTAIGEGNESKASIELEVKPIAPPETPNNLKVTAKDQHIELSWDSVAQAESYLIYLIGPDQNIAEVSPIESDVENIKINNLENGKNYKIFVKAVNNSGESPEIIVDEVVPTTTLKVATGATHACVIKSDNSLWCWGDNNDFALGIGLNESKSSPVQVGDDFSWAELGLGSTHSCASKIDGSLWCWGDNDSDQLGIVSDDIEKPTQVDLDHFVTLIGITAQSQTTCEIDGDSNLHCWGQNFFGQGAVDNSEYDKITIEPTHVADSDLWSQVSVGPLHSCGITTNGNLWCWGANFFGQIGDETISEIHQPTLIDEDLSWASVAVGANHSCAITTGDSLWCWGDNTSGQLGNGNEDTQYEPKEIEAGESWKNISLGNSFSCAVKRDNTLWCWGDNFNGQLGINSEESSNEPVQVGTESDWKSVSAGDAFTCAIKLNGDLYCWGGGEYGQTGHGGLIGENIDVPNITEPTLVEF